ncbi:NAD(+) synthase [Burkholderia cenocepacia]|uniref:NAD(+) synthase n=1 Tax=Burkholderia cenocepacia TaxID=95486 RepID=UPI00076CA47F|nr:NAD(+) synthase [Burkholderia cenocepacia]KWU26441.1 hypothetical protein AS149_25985 [Burkholderia cenocepacia]
MKVTNPQFDANLRPALRDALTRVRSRRAFDASSYIDRKARLLVRYLRESSLSAVVVAVSGGIDSAVVAGIAVRAHQLAPDVLRRVVPVLLPVTGTAGATGQKPATSRGAELCAQLLLEPTVIDLGEPHLQLRRQTESALNVQSQPWAQGQLVSYLRTPTLYYVTSLLSEAGQPSVLLGTTNRDEGAYLGYFGKASDGMVDVQVISDIHKSEVYEVARHLEVPASILTVAPTGDMYDARVDEEVFGAPYDFVELFLAVKADASLGVELEEGWSDADCAQFAELSTRLENMHRYNGHKYLGMSPAVHLDLWDASVPGGWKYCVFNGEFSWQR